LGPAITPSLVTIGGIFVTGGTFTTVANISIDKNSKYFVIVTLPMPLYRVKRESYFGVIAELKLCMNNFQHRFLFS
jgi:hypothetical protein